MNFETLARKHNRKTFDCGNSQVNDFLATKALQHQKKGVCTTQVLTTPGTEDVVAFYTLTPISIECKDLPSGSPNSPYSSVPVVLIGWMGIDSTMQDHGNGQVVLLEALDHALGVMEGFAGIGVVLDAINRSALSWYLKQEVFTQLPGYPDRLLVSRKTLERAKTESKL